jgi:cytochrome oxidase Cu insertion factor (SCO1/SenC/PrrC family)
MIPKSGDRFSEKIMRQKTPRNDGETKSRRPRASVLALALSCMLIAALVPARADDTANPSAAALIEALLEGREPVGGPFDLIDQAGRRRTDADFRGKLVLLYFGYTHCPDVCPTELQALSLALGMLGPAGEAVQPLFITVDPERDTPSHLADYVTAFHPRLVALTGPDAAIRKVALAYKVYFARNSLPQGGDYAVDHTGFIYLVGKDGRYLGFLPPGSSPEQIAEAVRERLAEP